MSKIEVGGGAGGGGGGTGTSSTPVTDSYLSIGCWNGQTIPTGGSPTTILLDTIDSSLGDDIALPSLPSAGVTITNAGLYVFTTQTVWANSGVGTRSHRLVLTPSSYVADTMLWDAGAQTPTATGYKFRTGPRVLPVAAGTVVSVAVTQSSGGDLDVSEVDLTIARIL